MMDDIRPPRRDLERRDYTMPERRPEEHRPHPVHHPAHHEPANLQTSPPPQPSPPYHHSLAKPSAHPSFHHTVSQHQMHAPKRWRPRLAMRYVAVAAALIISIGLFTAGYVFKTNTPDKTIPVAVVKKANFDVFFPSPMPSGYIYVSKTATFQIGDVFYRFADGLKSVTVREEPLPAKKPNLALYKGYTVFNAGAGQAALGTSFGQPVAVIVTPTTVITMNTSGGVSVDELKTAISNLHNIGSSSQGVNNG